jgi:hypothetical protein
MEWQHEKLGKSSPQRTMIKLNQAVKSNLFKTLEID